MCFINLAIKLYHFLIKVLAKCNFEKAYNFIEYRKDLFRKIKEALKNEDRKVLWFHCASVGEFEQAKPLIDKCFKLTDKVILITFFSPSAFVNISKYKYAHYIFPLPLDSSLNAKKFLDIVNPDQVFFIKYDYWPFYFKEIAKRNVDLFMVSAIFHSGTLVSFLRKCFFRKIFKAVTHFFVQDINSAKILFDLGFKNYTVIGDTRFDRVLDIKENPVNLPVIKYFLDHSSVKSVLIMGSVYPKDVKIFLSFVKKFIRKKGRYPYSRVVIVPHELSDVNNIIDLFDKYLRVQPLLYSDLSQKINLDINKCPFLIVDRMGLLPYIYRYTKYHNSECRYYSTAYIGGGFDKGIHNCLEPAIFQLPIIIGGTNYKKSKEVKELMNLKACFNIQTDKGFLDVYNMIGSRTSVFMRSRVRKYIITNSKAGSKVFDYVNQ